SFHSSLLTHHSLQLLSRHFQTVPLYSLTHSSSVSYTNIPSTALRVLICAVVKRVITKPLSVDCIAIKPFGTLPGQVPTAPSRSEIPVLVNSVGVPVAPGCTQ